MKNIEFNKKEKEIIKKANLEKESDLNIFIEKISDYMMLNCINENDELNDEGIIIEDILNKL